MDFAANKLLRFRMEREFRVDLNDRSQEVASALHSAFGAPDKPRWPIVLVDSAKYQMLTNQESLSRAAGPVGRNFDLVEVGLFRKQCAQCHGITGDGLGPTAALLDPYPRDFRRGTFKFKNAAYGNRPSIEDLIQTITYGVPGTSMPAMANLKRSKHYADDIPVLARYVRFLAIRGEVERELMMDTIRDLDSDEILFDIRQKDSAPEAFEKNQKVIDQVITRVADRWLASSIMEASTQNDQHIDSPFNAFIKRNQFAENDLRLDSTAMPADLFQASLRRGRTLFEGSIAACAQCHGEDGTGNAKWKDYDEWTKDWTIRTGIDPTVKAEWKPLKKLGLLKPVVASPRNLALQAYRGTVTCVDSGDVKVDSAYSHKRSSRLAILRAVLNGLEGSPMPAAALAATTTGGLTDNQIMDLVRFVESLAVPKSFLATEAILVSSPKSESVMSQKAGHGS